MALVVGVFPQVGAAKRLQTLSSGRFFQRRKSSRGLLSCIPIL
jgi:hypothetical protein